MRTLIRLYNQYITKIGIYFKQFIIINILFISLVYPLSNTKSDIYENNFHKINQDDSDAYRQIMPKALEAEMLVENHEYSRAAKIYYEICLISDDIELAKRATQVSGYARNFDLMLKSSDRWFALAENKISVMHVRISIFIALNKIDLATKETLSIINLSKDKDKYALVYDTLKVFDDKTIKKIFDQVYKKYKDEYLANFYYVQILLNNDAYEEAIKIIEYSYKFKEFNKKESRWGIFLADAYYEIGETDLSVKVLKDYLNYSPKDIYLNQYYARILTLQERYKEALDHYRFMSANKLIDFSDKEVAKKMALLNIEAKKYIDAMTFINSLKDKNISDFHYLSGIVSTEKKNYEAAESFFLKINHTDENYINSVKEISKIKIINKEISSLKIFFASQYKEVKDNKELDMRLILLETEIFFSEKYYKYAMKRINYGLEKYENNGAFLYTRALVAEQIDRLDILESDLKKVISMDPSNAQALNALGYTWANKNMKLKEANKFIDEALLLEPNDAAILDSKGWVLYRMGKYHESENYFRKALKLNEDTEIVSHYVQLLLKLNKIKEAKKIYKKYLKITPKDEKLNELKNLFQ